MSRLDDLHRRRDRLVLKSAAQRDTVTRHVRALERPLALVDRGLTALQYLRAHPAYLVVGIAVVVALRPRRALVWAGRGLAAWRAYRLGAAQIRRIFG